jgi:hypothetical protein
MDILAAEKDIVSQLESSISNIKILAYPDNPNIYNVMGPNGAILVRYNRSDYDEPIDNAVRKKREYQIRTAEWVITIIYRNLRSHTNDSDGVYTYIENVRTSLTGHTPNVSGRVSVMHPVKDGWIDRDETRKLWYYEIVFRHTYDESVAWQ